MHKGIRHWSTYDVDGHVHCAYGYYALDLIGYVGYICDGALVRSTSFLSLLGCEYLSYIIHLLVDGQKFNADCNQKLNSQSKLRVGLKELSC
ncbi:hypothetical protein F0562_003607 [Nyssa sinensis]|uniref:Uncharacterized protein n=1 Tax=Nyssa sinensis TaxID=561372 RepID=A0A5J5BWZ0_9ASTE|nr:hypothetical protein F0562_003607 [Nyssa sinensis]